MYWKYLFAWFGLVVLGLLNAMLRKVAYARYVSELVGHQISTLTLCKGLWRKPGPELLDS